MMSKNPAALGNLKTIALSLLIGSILVAPFVVLEWVNRRAFQEEFPFVLFSFMSVNALFIALLLTPALQRLRLTRTLSALKPGHWVGLALSAFFIFVYANVIIDQLPCFLGTPICD